MGRARVTSEAGEEILVCSGHACLRPACLELETKKTQLCCLCTRERSSKRGGKYAGAKAKRDAIVEAANRRESASIRELDCKANELIASVREKLGLPDKDPENPLSDDARTRAEKGFRPALHSFISGGGGSGGGGGAVVSTLVRPR